MPTQSAPLAGLRVLEIASEIAGPYCGKLLADLGARVTKVEPPDGDPLRRWGPFPGGVVDAVAQIEACACVTAEAVIAHSMNGVVPAREGNRQRGYLQGLYPTREEGAWVALSIRDDRDWQQLLAAMGHPEPLREARFASQAGRIAAHDEVDASIVSWSQAQAADAIVSALEARRVPVARLLTPDRRYADPQLTARDLYCELVHPVTGARRYPGWPFRLAPGPSRHHLSPPPTLGQHNQDVLSTRLGLSAREIQELAERKVIGTKPLNA